jgi:hypothetical protein
MTKVNIKSLRGKVDDYIINTIKLQLPRDHVLVDTGWLEVNDVAVRLLDASKTAVCYSGIDWENTNCIESRVDAHALIRQKSKAQIHIGNSNGAYYFSYWAEFIRQNPDNFFDDIYTATPQIEKLFLSLNRKEYPHRNFFLDLLDENNLADLGFVSRPSQPIGKLHYNVDPHDGERNIQFPNDIYGLGDADVWRKIFLNVVVETTKHSNVFLSEKTWKPIIGLRPFLILGDYKLYPKLKENGFDTFDDLFGTWWEDSEWKNRARSIIDILKSFGKQEKDLNKLYLHLQPRLLYNKNNFITYMNINHNKICNLGLI